MPACRPLGPIASAMSAVREETKKGVEVVGWSTQLDLLRQSTGGLTAPWASRTGLLDAAGYWWSFEDG